MKPNKSKFLQIKTEPYVIINLIFVAIIVTILIYSAIFSDSGIPHPIKSLATKDAVSSGLSRAFSEIIRLNFSDAIQFNQYSISIFLFFVIQLFLRIITSVLLLNSYITEKLLLITDILVTVLLFLLTFSEFISDQF